MLMKRLGLDRKELRAWALYDWANSAFWSTVVSAVFPIYFARVAASGLTPAEATTRYALSTTLALALVAVFSPFLGAMADYKGAKKKFLGAFVGVGVLATAAMVFVGEGDWKLGALLFIIGNIGVTGSIVFYESLLPHVAKEDELDRVSGAGYALGYLGGALLLALNLACILYPETFGFADSAAASRFSFLTVAVWWLVFSIPLFRTVPEPPRAPASGTEAGMVRASIRRVGTTLSELRTFKHAFLFLSAFLLYNDGIQTIIRMATIYGSEVGFSEGVMLSALLLSQFIGVPCAFAFGALAERVGPKPAIFAALVAYVGISILGYSLKTPFHFYLLAALVGMVQGGAQAVSRSLFARMIPRHRSSEFFAFFSVFEKFAGIFGPALFGVTVAMTGSSRSAVLSVIAFFLVGGTLLHFVDPAEGQRVARAAEAEQR